MKFSRLFKIFSACLILVSAQLVTPLSHASSPAPADSDLGVCAAPRSLPAARTQAHRLVKQIRADLAGVEDQIRTVPFLAEVEAGTASLEQIAAVAAEQYSIIRSDWSSFSQMTARFDDPQSRQFFGGIASGEAIALDLLIDSLPASDLTSRTWPPTSRGPRARPTRARVAWIAANADRAAAGASFLVNFAVFGENIGRLRNALVKAYGFSIRRGTGLQLLRRGHPWFRGKRHRGYRCWTAPRCLPDGGPAASAAAPGLRAGFLAGSRRTFPARRCRGRQRVP